MKILASYVTNGGDLVLVDKSCVDQVNTLEMLPSASLTSDIISTEGAFEHEPFTLFEFDGSSDTDMHYGSDPTMVAVMSTGSVLFAWLVWSYQRRQR